MKVIFSPIDLPNDRATRFGTVRAVQGAHIQLRGFERLGAAAASDTENSVALSPPRDEVVFPLFQSDIAEEATIEDDDLGPIPGQSPIAFMHNCENLIRHSLATPVVDSPHQLDHVRRE